MKVEKRTTLEQNMEGEDDSVSKSEKCCASVTPFSINDILNCSKTRESEEQDRALDMSKAKWTRGEFV